MKLKLLKEEERKEPQIVLDFLDVELQEFISKVTDVTRRKWLADYTKEQLDDVLTSCYEWCATKEHAPKNVALLVRKFLKGVPKKSEVEDIAGKLDELLRSNDA